MLVEFKNFSYYSGNKEILKKINLKIDYGEELYVIGNNGAGKSTIVNALLGFLDSKSVDGEIFFDQALLCADNILKIRKSIGTIFQDPETYLNPILNIKSQIFEVNSNIKEIYDILQNLKLPKDILELYPHQLSGGQKQRILILIALASKPMLVIADEPFTSLNIELREDIFSLIHKYKKKYGFALMVISHNFDLIREKTKRTIYLSKGEVLQDRPFETLDSSKIPLLEEYLRLQ